MTASLTPSLALAHLHELSVDIRAAVVLDATGAPLAGDAHLAPRVRALLEAADGAASGIRRADAEDGVLLVVQRSDGLRIAALAGFRAVLPLIEHDLAVVAQELAATGS